MKRLVIEALYTEWGILVRVAEQTHRGCEFGKDSRSFTDSTTGFRLISLYKPATDENAFNVRGDDNTQDHKIMFVPSHEWLIKLRNAVTSYNKAQNCKTDIFTFGTVERIF